MPRAASARRYAQAVFQIALENDELDRWRDDLSLLANAQANPEFAEFLDAPQVTVSQKSDLINSTLSDSVGPLVLNLTALLASRGTAYLLPNIAEQFNQMLDAHRGIERAEVISAVPLDDEQTQKVAQMLQDIVGKDVRLTTRVEPQILGGILARVGDKVIDGSTRAKLQEMRRQLVE